MSENSTLLSPRLQEIGRIVRPLRDRVLIQRLEFEHPVLAVVGITLQKGIIVAVGPGRRLKRKTPFNGFGDRVIWFEDGDETGIIRPARVHVGEIVEFGVRNQVEWEFMGEKLTWIWEQSIYGTTNDSRHQALLWQESAGHDRHGNFMSGSQESTGTIIRTGT